MKHTTIVLESLKGLITLYLDMPIGKPLILQFKQEKQGDNFKYNGAFFCEVPTVVEYIDMFKKTIRLKDNYAQELLDNYNKKDQYGEVIDQHFKVLEVKKPPVVEEVPIVEPPISKRKGKQNEKTNS
jgi:hypothetical protein